MKTILPVSLVTSVGTKIWVAQSVKWLHQLQQKLNNHINQFYISDPIDIKCKIICTWPTVAEVGAIFQGSHTEEYGLSVVGCISITKLRGAGVYIIDAPDWGGQESTFFTINSDQRRQPRPPLLYCVVYLYIKINFSLHRGRAQTFHNSTFVVSIKL